MFKLGGIVTREISNSGRQTEVDICKGLAVFFMVLVHFNSAFLDTAYNNTAFAKIIDFMGCVPAAPVFMFVMGIGFVYSKKQNPQLLFKRGLLVFGGGYLLNMTRGVMPLLIGNKLGYYELPETDLIGYGYLIESDILQFAGLAMIVVSFFKAVKIKEIYYPFIAVIAAIISPYMWSIPVHQPILEAILAPVFGGKSYTYHPLFSWIFYPLMGAFFGWLLIRTRNKKLFYLKASIVSILAASTAFLVFYKPGYDFGIVAGNIYNYFQHGILSCIIFCSGVICWLSIWNFLVPVIPKFIKNRLIFWSKATTPMYVIHWLIINWCSFLVFDTFDIKQSILGMVLVLFLTDNAADIYIKIRNRLADREEVDIPVIIDNRS